MRAPISAAALAIGSFALQTRACLPPESRATGWMNCEVTCLAEQSIAPQVASAATESGGITVDVAIENFAFSPPNITIPTGSNVRWTNFDFFAHTATSTAMPPVWDSGTLFFESVYQREFDAVGAFEYECIFHFGMVGSVNARLPGDATGDNSVNISDFSILASNFNTSPRTYSQGDFNLNGTVEISDFAILAANFNTSAGSRGAAIPEPASGSVGLTATALLARWRSREPSPRRGEHR